MEVPYKGKVNMRLVAERFKNKTFYYVNGSKSGDYKLEPCLLSKDSFNSMAFVIPLNELHEPQKWSHGASWGDIYDVFEDAEKEVKNRNNLYNSFKYKPFLGLQTIKEHFQDLIKIEQDICKLLKGFDNFQGIDFCDVSANGIQIRGHHKKIKDYTYGQQPTIKYDFSNKDSIVMEFVNMWYEHDTPSKVSAEKRFIAAGEKYGWD